MIILGDKAFFFFLEIKLLKQQENEAISMGLKSIATDVLIRGRERHQGCRDVSTQQNGHRRTQQEGTYLQTKERPQEEPIHWHLNLRPSASRIANGYVSNVLATKCFVMAVLAN